MFRVFVVTLIFASFAGITIAQGYRPGQSFNSSGQSQATPVPAQPIYNMQQQSPTTPSPRATKSTPPPKPKTSTAAKTPTKPKRTPETERSETSEDVPDKTWKTQNVKPGEAARSAEPPLARSVTSSTNPLVINSWPTGKKLVALTYDDGPDPFTPKLLDYLDEQRIPATFYMLGERVKEYPQYVQRIVQSGHELGNHTYNHKQLTKMSAEGIRDELTSTHDLMTSASNGAPIPTMRPPFGAQNATVRSICEQLGYKVIMWDVDTNDWMGRPASQMINTILKGTSDGSIILMHDRLHRKTDTVLPTTKAVVADLRARGYTFVTVSQMLSNRRGVPVIDKPTSVPIAQAGIPASQP